MIITTNIKKLKQTKKKKTETKLEENSIPFLRSRCFCKRNYRIHPRKKKKRFCALFSGVLVLLILLGCIFFLEEVETHTWLQNLSMLNKCTLALMTNSSRCFCVKDTWLRISLRPPDPWPGPWPLASGPDLFLTVQFWTALCSAIPVTLIKVLAK